MRERICNKKLSDLIILQVALRQISLNVWIWDSVKRLIKPRSPVSVVSSVRCVSLSLGTPLITFRTRGEKWVKIKSEEHRISIILSKANTTGFWCLTPSCILPCVWDARWPLPASHQWSCRAKKDQVYKSQPAHLKHPLCQKGHIQRLLYGFIYFYKQQDI